MVCFQETHLRDSEIRYLRENFKWSIYHASTIRRSKGVMIGNSRDLPWVLQKVVVDEEGRFVMLKGKLYHMDLCLVGVYAPHGSQQSYWQKVLSSRGVQSQILIGLV